MNNKTISLFVKAGMAFFCLAMAICTTSCDGKKQTATIAGDVTIKYNTPKYVFYFIGDGMALPQVRMAEAAMTEQGFKDAYAKATGKTINREKLNIRTLPATGMATNHAENRFITCSAAAATALATGHKTTLNTISMNGDRTENLPTMAEMAKAHGKKVGILTSVSIDHATPACFYAHTEDRNSFETIGEYLLASNFDYFAGGFVRHDTYKKKTLEQYLQMAKDSGYTFVNNRDDFDALKNGSGKVFATIGGMDSYNGDEMAIPYNIDLDIQGSDNQKITLADFTRKGIELLDNENGFFMMIEGGKIDWVGHANDVVTNAYETVAFDDAIGEALAFYQQHPEETLIVVTGDHETGGLTLGFAGTYYETAFGMLVEQNISFKRYTDEVRSWRESKVNFNEALASLQEAFGLGDTTAGLKLSEYEVSRLKDAFEQSMNPRSSKMSREERSVAYGTYDPFTVTATHILANKAGIDWTSYSHTGLPVAVFAIGQGSELFNGYYDNTDIAKRIMQVGAYLN